MRFFEDVPTGIPVRWFFCDPDAPVFTDHHRYGSSNWDTSHEPYDGIGEQVTEKPHKWSNGKMPVPPQRGEHFCGALERFQRGSLLEDIGYILVPGMHFCCVADRCLAQSFTTPRFFFQVTRILWPTGGSDIFPEDPPIELVNDQSLTNYAWTGVYAGAPWSLFCARGSPDPVTPYVWRRGFGSAFSDGVNLITEGEHFHLTLTDIFPFLSTFPLPFWDAQYWITIYSEPAVPVDGALLQPGYFPPDYFPPLYP